MGCVTGKDPVKVAATEDQGPVQDLGANDPHPASGVHVGLRGTDGREDNPCTLGSEHGVEGGVYLESRSRIRKRTALDSSPAM